MNITKKISKSILKLAGWQVKGGKPKEKKYLIIAAPHTSNWDFPLARLTNSLLEIKLQLLMKESWFFFPFKYVLKWLGVVPIDRSKTGGVIAGIVEMYKANDEFVFAMAPEGTRSYVEFWKTGFYTIASRANVPIVCGYLDYKKKELGLGLIIYPSGDSEKDFEKILSFYRTKLAKFPEKFNQHPRFGKK